MKLSDTAGIEIQCLINGTPIEQYSTEQSLMRIEALLKDILNELKR